MSLFDKCFGKLKDPRVIGRCKYPLQEMLLTTVCCMMGGGKSYRDMADYGENCLDFLKTFFPFKNGVPEKDAFRDLYLLLDPEQFEECLFDLFRSVTDKPSDIIAIDGKCLRGSQTEDSNLVNMVSAWCSENSLILGQVAVTNKSNEITAIPKLLNFLDLKGKVITLDAMGCQRDIAELVIDKKGDYVCSLKGNQGSLHKDVKEFFEAHKSREYQDGIFHYEEKIEEGHGRIEIRKYTITPTLDWGLKSHEWPGLKAVGMVESTRKIKGKDSHETRHFLTSLDNEPERFVRAIRTHWEVENKVHWVLDVSFDEDRCRIRVGNGPKNISIIRRYLLNLIRKYGDPKRSIRRNMNKANVNHEFMRKLLLGLA